MIEQTTAASGGANPVRVKAYNERLALTLLRRHGELAKADISRLSGLSAQAMTVLIRGLEADQLVLRGEPRRGKVGQPSVPYRIDPDGAFSVGVKIGRRSADVVLVDFLGNVRAEQSVTYRWPDPKRLLRFATEATQSVIATLTAEQRTRVVGAGVAMPFRIWEWPAELGAPGKQLDAWRDMDFGTQLSDATGIDVSVHNDGTSACGSELAFGGGDRYQDFVYYFVATFIGGGIVLNRTLYPGRTGNAATLGTMVFTHDDGSTTQLLHHASVLSLEQTLAEKGASLDGIKWQSAATWKRHKAEVDAWLDSVSYYLAVAIGSACSIVDFEAAIIDGVFPDDIKADLVARVIANIDRMGINGVSQPAVVGGRIGQQARVIGGASRPIMDRYFLDQNVLFKTLN